MIHGGPDTPKYKSDVIDYFGSNPHVDVAVHVEGEVSTAEVLTELIGNVGKDGPADLSVLRDVGGISFRDGDRVVQTPGRDRLEALDVIPSPVPHRHVRQLRRRPHQQHHHRDQPRLPLRLHVLRLGLGHDVAHPQVRPRPGLRGARVVRPSDGIHGIGFADANFGILERDVAIAEKLAELKATYGFPSICATNYAKNTVKHLQKIVQTWVDAGIVTQGMLSLQTMDTETLTTIRRSNIKTEKYDALAEEFRKADLPLFVDLMMGLPGQSVTSFRRDLQDTLEPRGGGQDPPHDAPTEQPDERAGVQEAPPHRGRQPRQRGRGQPVRSERGGHLDLHRARTTRR